LSQQQRTIIALLASGKRTKGIAEELAISERVLARKTSDAVERYVLWTTFQLVVAHQLRERTAGL